MEAQFVTPEDIYFACAIRGEQGGLEEKQLMVRILKELGHNVLSEIFLEQNANWNQLGVMTPGQIVDQDLDWIEEGSFLVADVTRLSHGVGFELGWAAARAKRTVVLCREDRFYGLSNMIKGFGDSKYCKPGTYSVHTWRGLEYPEDVKEILEHQLGRVNPQSVLPS